MMKGFLREKHKEDEKKPTRYFSKQQEKEVAKLRAKAVFPIAGLAAIMISSFG